jgi:hypothetical protein
MKSKTLWIRLALIPLLILTSFSSFAQEAMLSGFIPAAGRSKNQEDLNNSTNSVCSLLPNSTIDAIPSGIDSLSLIINSDATRIDSIRIVYHNVCGMTRLAAGFRINPGVLIDPITCSAQWQFSCIANILEGHQVSINFSSLTATTTLKSRTNCSSACATRQFTFPTITALNELEDKYMNQPELEQNYPNPFNSGTMIRFSLPHVEFVTLNIFNASGNQTTLLLSQNMPAGKHQVEWNAYGMAEGVYFYRLQAGSFIQTRKLLLLR